MGNNQTVSKSFNPSLYVRQGITEQEVVGLRNVFESLEPKDDIIETSILRNLYRDSYDAPQLNLEIGNRQTLNFQEFFEIMSRNLIQMKQTFKGDVQFEDRAEDVTCLFCPQSRPQRQAQ